MMQAGLLHELGLAGKSGFTRDQRFYLALLGAPYALVLLDGLLPGWGDAMPPAWRQLALLVLWRPLVEELLFRGVIQGQLARRARWRRRLAGISLANLATSLLFALAHVPYHGLAWSGAVILPSLLFGYFRERHQQVYPAILLHAAYNACYFLLQGLD